METRDLEATAMKSESLQHDVAWATAANIVDVFASLLREEEKREAFVEVYARVKAGIECFQIQQTRLEQRMRPGNN
jgi:hypothetical protein